MARQLCVCVQCTVAQCHTVDITFSCTKNTTITKKLYDGYTCTVKICTNCEVPFFRSVFNDGHDQFIMIAVLLPSLSSTDALDHLLVGDLELLTRVEKSGHYCSLGASVNDSTST